MGPGVDPHLYKASEGDVLRLGTADVIFYGGLHLEAKLAEVLERLGERVKTVAVTDGIDRSVLLEAAAVRGAVRPARVVRRDAVDEGGRAGARYADRDGPGQRGPTTGRTRPPTWRNWRNCTAYVKAQAARVPPETSGCWSPPTTPSTTSAGRTGSRCAACRGSAPPQRRAHRTCAGSPISWPQRKIRAIFIESSVPVRNIEAVQAAVRSRGWDIAIGGELFSDAMGSAGTPEGTYIGMVRHNIDTIVKALLGE